MPRLVSVSRSLFIQRLQAFGFDGPYSGGRHQFMIKGTNRLILPDPHRSEIGVDLLVRLLRQARISREEWIKES